MINKSTLLVFLATTFWCTFSLQSQVTYVNASATGLNDGSDWTNAFTSLDNALDKFNNTSIFTDEEIWVASGTYKPGRDIADTSSTFSIIAPVDLYGGFDGSETERDQRDIEKNQVILSGDLLDNDNGGIDSLDRLDNVRHVVTVDASVPRRITFDGFTITGGHASDNINHNYINRAGGGIISFSAMVISNCTFTNNSAQSGGSIAFENDDLNNGTIGDPVILSNCVFDKNFSNARSAGPIFQNVKDVEVKNCTFVNNITNRGCCYPVDCENVLIEDCLFENNTNPEGFGGGMFVWQTLNLQLINCEFKGNSAVNSGAVYYDAREVVFADMTLLVEGCKFTDNSSQDFCGGFRINEGKNMVFNDNEFSLNQSDGAGGFYYDGGDSPKSNISNLIIRNSQFRSNQSLDGAGGGFRTFQGSYTLENCSFLGNVAAGGNSGGALFSNGDNKEIEINNCLFGTNASNWGAGMAIYGDTTIALVKNCSFLSNNADSRGAGVYGGFKASVAIDSCLFRGNLAGSGGAISSQNDTTSLVITNSEFNNNTANNSGGAIYTTGGSYTRLFNCLLQENEGNFGGALAFDASENPQLDTAKFIVQNCVVFANTATEQAGGININDINGRIENTLIHENRADGEGRGGAISHNVADSFGLSIQLDIINSTLANNLGLFSSGIAAYTDLEGEGTINLQNTLLYNLRDFRVEAGSPELISRGGNFSRDITNMTQYFGSDDVLESDPMFVDLSSTNYRLMQNSPCINAGIATDAPERDLQGYIRDSSPDIGCFEFVLNTPIEDIETIEFKVYPNPASDVISLDITSADNHGSVYIYDALGQVVKVQKLNTTNQINIADLNNGLYFILVNGHRKYQSTFVKE